MHSRSGRCDSSRREPGRTAYIRAAMPVVRRTVCAALLAMTAAGTAGLLVVSPSAPTDTTLPLLTAAVGGLALLAVAERACPSLSPRAILGAAGCLLVLAIARPPHG